MIDEPLKRRRHYDADSYFKHFWLRTDRDMDERQLRTGPSNEEVRRKIIDHELPVVDEDALQVLAAGLRLMNATVRGYRDVPLERAKRIRSALVELRTELPEWAAYEQFVTKEKPDGRLNAIIRYKLLVRIIEWLLHWSVFREDIDLKQPRDLWHDDAKWLACAISRTCAAPNKPLKFSAQGANNRSTKQMELLYRWLPRPPGSRALIANTLAGRNNGHLRPPTHFENLGNVEYPLHEHGWRARI